MVNIKGGVVFVCFYLARKVRLSLKLEKIPQARTLLRDPTHDTLCGMAANSIHTQN